MIDPKFRRYTSFAAHCSFEILESRRHLSATVVGSSTVYASIQAAVNAAPANGVVKVTAGTYDELVTINKPLTLLGSQSGVDARSPVRGRNETVVDGLFYSPGNRSSAFDVTANDVTLDGFTVQDQTNGNNFGAGIVLAPSIAGTHVLDNIVQNNVVGLYLSNNSATDPAVIRHNVFANNNNPGNNNGRGIYTDGGVSGGLLTNVLINANTFVGNVGDGTSGNPESAVGLEAQTAGKQFNITITNNIMTGNGKGLLVHDASGVTFAGNLITGSKDTTSAAVRIEGDVSNMTITGNTVLGGSGAAIRITDRFVGPSSNISVSYNNFAGNTTGGVIVDAGGYVGTLNAQLNYWGSATGPSAAGTSRGQLVSTGVDFSNYLAVAKSLPSTFAADNGLFATLAADATIISYAFSLQNLALLGAITF